MSSSVPDFARRTELFCAAVILVGVAVFWAWFHMELETVSEHMASEAQRLRCFNQYSVALNEGGSSGDDGIKDLVDLFAGYDLALTREGGIQRITVRKQATGSGGT